MLNSSLFLLLSLHAAFAADPIADPAVRARTHGCPALTGGKVEGAAGQRKLAMIVGVGDYLFVKPDGTSIDLSGGHGHHPGQAHHGVLPQAELVSKL